MKHSIRLYIFIPSCHFPESGSVSRHLGHKLREHEKENKGALQAIFFKKTLYLYYKRENYLFQQNFRHVWGIDNKVFPVKFLV